MQKVFTKNIFNEAEVGEIRNYLKDFLKADKREHYKAEQGEHYYVSIESIKQNQLLWNFIFNKKVLEFIKKSFNEKIYFYNNIVIQKNNLRFNKRSFNISCIFFSKVVGLFFKKKFSLK